MFYPDNFEYKIGFDKIRNLVKQHCLFSLGQENVDKMVFHTKYEEVLILTKQVLEFKKLSQLEDTFPADHFYDATPALNKAKIEGAFIEESELFELKRSLESIKSIIHFFKKKEDIDYPELKKLCSGIMIFPFVLDKINMVINNYGKIKDNASRELADIRMQIKNRENDLSKKINHILKQAQKDGIVEEDAALSVRNGRIVIPVNSANKRKIKGYVHDESATGKTAYIEPAEIVELNNEIKELEYAERREIINILTDTTTLIRPYVDDLLKAYIFLGLIDFIRAKAMFAIRLFAVLPQVKNEPIVKWIRAIHPLLYLNFKKENKKVVPLDLTLTQKERILLISGPNAGGKSVCLQTAGLLQYMLQCGLLVPMEEDSEMGIFDSIFINIGDEQSIENDLSTYSSHLHNMKFFTKHSDQKSMILIDEFGAGTEPMLGGAIAESILDSLNNKQCFGIITTHYTNLKHFASNTDGIVNGAMLYDLTQMQPLFRLSIGKPGSSFAFEIARKIGLPEEILKKAEEKVGKEHIDFDKNLRNIARDKRYWEEKRDHIRISGKKLDELIEKYTKELDSIQQQRKQILDKAKQEAGQLLTGANKTIENTIRTIKENQAEKEITKIARTEVEELKQQIATEIPSEDLQIATKLNNINERQKKREIRFPKEEVKKIVIIENKIITVGDFVKLQDQETVAKVLSIKGNDVTIAIGNLMSKVHLSKLKKISKEEYILTTGERTISSSNNNGYNVFEKRLDFKSEVDLRGKRTDEALEIVKNLVDEAIVLGIFKLRILHGKGDGILRQMIRNYLKTEKVVKSCKDEQEQFGGSGITIIELE